MDPFCVSYIFWEAGAVGSAETLGVVDRGMILRVAICVESMGWSKTKNT